MSALVRWEAHSAALKRLERAQDKYLARDRQNARDEVVEYVDALRAMAAFVEQSERRFFPQAMTPGEAHEYVLEVARALATSSHENEPELCLHELPTAEKALVESDGTGSAPIDAMRRDMHRELTSDERGQLIAAYNVELERLHDDAQTCAECWPSKSEPCCNQDDCKC